MYSVFRIVKLYPCGKQLSTIILCSCAGPFAFSLNRLVVALLIVIMFVRVALTFTRKDSGMLNVLKCNAQFSQSIAYMTFKCPTDHLFK